MCSPSGSIVAGRSGIVNEVGGRRCGHLLELVELVLGSYAVRHKS